MRKRFRPGDRVVVLRDIARNEGPYAKAGEAGAVIETFEAWLGWHAGKTVHAQVRMDDGGVKTFRLTSIQNEADCVAD